MKYDLHIHTHRSACSILKPRTLLKVAKKAGLDGIAVTDHDTVKGGLEVKKENRDKDFEVIPGVEVYTNKGHVLGYYVEEEIRSRDFFDVVGEIKRKGGIVGIAHPFRFLPMLRASFRGMNVKKCFDVVECYNARTFYFGNRSAIKFAEKYGLGKVAGSDAHFSFEVGRCRTLFDGDLVSAIKRRKTKVEGSSVTGLVGSTLSFFTKRVFRRW